jgi:hypothetical protein
MGNVIKLSSVKRARQQDKAKGLTLCGAGFHQWTIVSHTRFDVREGKLLTTERCARCQQERTTLK